MIGITIAITFLLTGCSVSGGAGAGGTSGRDRPVVLTTFTVLADIARNVAGNHLDVESITKDGAENHDYEPTPQDVAKASRADLLLDNGLGLETWFKQFSESAHVPQVVLTKGVKTIDAVRADHVPAVFCESTASPKAMRQVADATGARFGGTLYVDSLSTADGAVPTYLALIRHDATTIVDGLTGRSS